MMPAWMVLSIVIKKQYRYLFFGLPFIVLLYGMVCLSISRHYSYVAAKRLHIMEPAAALQKLNKALSILPPYIFQADLQHIHTLFGKTYLGISDKQGRIKNLTLAKEHFLLAVHLNPNDIKAAKGLALTTGLHEPESSLDALPFYKRLAELRPNGISVHYMIAEYLHKRNLKKKLASTVEHLAMIAPGDVLNGGLTKAGFYNPELELFIRNGLEKAIEKNIRHRIAYFALARLSETTNQIEEAVSHYQKGLTIQPFRNNSNNYNRLGQLHLKNKTIEKAFKAFENSMAAANNFEKSIKQIYHIFKKQKAYKAFDTFAANIQTDSSHSTLDLYIARARIELGLNGLAKARLLNFISEKQNADAYYLLSVIARNENDWDAMELNIQKATVLSPGTCHYYNLFATALVKQGKRQQADIQSSKARQCSKTKT